MVLSIDMYNLEIYGELTKNYLSVIITNAEISGHQLATVTAYQTGCDQPVQRPWICFVLFLKIFLNVLVYRK